MSGCDLRQTEGRRRIRDWAAGLGDVIELGDLIFRLVSIVVRCLLRVIGGLLEGLSIFDI